MRGTWRRSINRIAKRNLVLLVGLVSGIAAGPASAQTPVQTIERSVKALPNKDAQIGIYVNVRADCTSGPLPTIRLVSPPASGKVVVKTAKVKATNFKACLALEVPGYVAFYKSAPDFLGADTLTIEVSFPEGRTEIQKITVTVGGAGAQQKI
jgi:hypothetical protein